MLERIRDEVMVEDEDEDEDGRKYNSGLHSFLLIDFRWPWECRHDEVKVGGSVMMMRMGHGTANHNSLIRS